MGSSLTVLSTVLGFLLSFPFLFSSRVFVLYVSYSLHYVCAFHCISVYFHRLFSVFSVSFNDCRAIAPYRALGECLKSFAGRLAAYLTARYALHKHFSILFRSIGMNSVLHHFLSHVTPFRFLCLVTFLWPVISDGLFLSSP